jgi:hypothetical protein
MVGGSVLLFIFYSQTSMMQSKIISAMAFVAMTLLPFAAQADIVSLQPLSAATVVPTTSGPLSCFDFHSLLKMGSKSYDVRGLQFALMQEGSSISSAEYGTFGSDTLAAVNAFQQKYASDILKNGTTPTGVVGKLTRAKLNALYGCGVASAPVASSNIPSSVILNVKNVALDSSGVTAIFCNQSPTDIPVFPVRVRLNGIIRDFNVPGALKAGACDTDTIPYGAWGLTYDPGSTYGVVTALDPNSMYKTAKVTYPLVGTTTLSVPAIQGAHLSVRGITIKSNGLQGTLCNLGTSDLSAYPVRVTVNGVSKDLDAVGVHTHGLCQTVTWTYDTFGLTLATGTIVTGTVNVDPNNIIQETNEFDNSATIVGSI